jgi:hypothetical protein
LLPQEEQLRRWFLFGDILVLSDRAASKRLVAAVYFSLLNS